MGRENESNISNFYIINCYGVEEYFYDTITNPRDFRGIGLHIYKNGNIERIPIENSIADFLFRFPLDYFQDYINMYFSDEVKKDLKKEGIKNYNSLIHYLRKSF